MENKRYDLIRIRIRYLKKNFRYLRNGAIIFSIAIIVLAILKWFITIPNLLNYVNTEESQALFIAKIGTILMAIISGLFIIAIVDLFVFFSRILKIKYSMIIDVAKLVLLFTIFTAILNTILWISFALAFYAENYNALLSIGLFIMRSESAVEMSISFSMILLSIVFMKLRRIVQDIIKEKTLYIWLLLFVSFLSFVEVALLVFYFIILMKKSRIVYSLAYIDIKLFDN